MNRLGQISMPLAGFEPTVAVSKRSRPAPRTSWPLLRFLCISVEISGGLSMEFETGSDSCNLWSSANISRSLRKWVGERAPAAFHRRLCALLLLLLRPLLPPRQHKIDMSCRFISPVALLPVKRAPCNPLSRSRGEPWNQFRPGCEETMEEIQSRIQAANRDYFSVLPLIKSRGIGWRFRVTLYKTVIHSI
jgi:hypothetical protein